MENGVQNPFSTRRISFIAVFCVFLFALTKTGSIRHQRFLIVDSIYHDEAFQNRHKREPREKNVSKNRSSDAPSASPTVDPCSLGNDGLYGSTSGNSKNIEYSYEIEVIPILLPKLESEVIPAVEGAITDSIARAFFLPCFDDIEMQTRRTRSNKVNSTRQMQSLELTGITTEPPDEVGDTLLCKAEKREPNSECRSVLGGLTLYFEEDSTNETVERSISEILLLVQSNMDEDKYISSYEGIIRVSFSRASLLQYKVEEVDVITVEGESDRIFNKSFSYILIGAISGTLIALALLFGKDDDEKYIGRDFVEIESVLTDDHIGHGNVVQFESMPDDFPQEVNDFELESTSTIASDPNRPIPI